MILFQVKRTPFTGIIFSSVLSSEIWLRNGDVLKTLFLVNEDDNCTICLEPLEEYDYLKIFAMKDGKEYGCGHVFHKKCIRKWLEKASACPLCMCQLPVDDNQAELDQIEAR